MATLFSPYSAVLLLVNDMDNHIEVCTFYSYTRNQFHIGTNLQGTPSTVSIRGAECAAPRDSILCTAFTGACTSLWEPLNCFAEEIHKVGWSLHPIHQHDASKKHVGITEKHTISFNLDLSSTWGHFTSFIQGFTHKKGIHSYESITNKSHCPSSTK